MKRLLPLVVLAAFAGCGSASTQTTRTAPTVARELHQPGPPIVRATVHSAPVPARAGPEGRDDGRLVAAGAICGKERWNVKTATDPAAGQIKLTPVKRSVRELGEQPTTNHNNPDQPRDSGVESQVYEVTAYLVEAKREADSDFHLVLKEFPPVEGEPPGADPSMIAEIPLSPACTEPPITAEVSVLEQQIESARAAFVQEFGEPQSYPASGLKIDHQVTLTGVGFFDVPHGQTGVAPNAAELHPVISIKDP